MKNIDTAIKVFSGDIFAVSTVGISILDAHDGYSRCCLPVEERHLNAMGFVMGGAIFTLADFAFAVAANNDVASTVSVNSSINFVNSAKCKTLYANAEPVKIGKSVCFYRITITDETEKLIATVNTTGYVVKSNH